jgi:hypothetical protein
LSLSLTDCLGGGELARPRFLSSPAVHGPDESATGMCTNSSGYFARSAGSGPTHVWGKFHHADGYSFFLDFAIIAYWLATSLLSITAFTHRTEI